LNNQFRQSLESGLEKLSLSLTSDKIDKLLAYHQLLIKWNKAYNLTAVRDPLVMIHRHLLDSLSVASYLKGDRFIDIGAGAGLPGIILAIIFPNKTFDLLDSNGKKTRFLFQVKTELQLDNVIIHHCRVEQHKISRPYDGVLSRAFSTLADMVEGSQQLLDKTGFFYAMKGTYPEAEIKQLSKLSKNYIIHACHQLDVPGESGQRHLILLSKD
jgi:16S rRNA (guanine527-N7)-methyltransferase